MAHHDAMLRLRRSVVVALLVLGGCGGKASGHSGAATASDRPRSQAYGRGALPQEATRAVEIHTDDRLRFDPATITVRRGEVVTFHVVNTGKTLHEFTIGGADAQDLHEAQMAQMAMTGGTMDMGSIDHGKYMKALAGRIATLDGSAAANASVHVLPGESRDLTWAFLGENVPVFGCHVAQHWSAGMRGTIVWAPS